MSQEFRSFIFLDVYHSEMQPETLLLKDEPKHQCCAESFLDLSSFPTNRLENLWAEFFKFSKIGKCFLKKEVSVLKELK